MISRSQVDRTSIPSSPAFILLYAAGAVLLIWLLAFGLLSRDATLPMLGIVAACLAVLVIVRPGLGVAAVLGSAALVQIEISTGTESPVVASLVCGLLLLGGWVVYRVIHRKPILLLHRSIALFGGLLIGANIVALFWGRATLDPRIIAPDTFIRVQLAQLGLIVVGIGLLVVGADLFRSPAARRNLVISFIVIGVVALPFRWLQIEPLTLNTAGLFGLWFVSLAWSNAVVNTRLPSYLRIALAVVSIAWVLMAILIEGSWVSGWLPALSAMVAVTLVARPRLGLASLFAVCIGVSIYFSVFYNLLITSQVAEGSIGGDFGRIALIERNISFLGDRLIVGTGPAGYALYYMAFLPDQAMSTHNNFLDMLSHAGIAGITGLAGLLVALFVAGRRTLRKITDQTDRAQAAAVVGAVPGLAGSLMLGDWLIPFVYNQTIAGFDHAVYSWLMLAMLCGLIAQYRRASRDAAA